jgi:hypothetical protein
MVATWSWNLLEIDFAGNVEEIAKSNARSLGAMPERPGCNARKRDRGPRPIIFSPLSCFIGIRQQLAKAYGIFAKF